MKITIAERPSRWVICASRVATIAGGSWSTQAGVTGNFADSFAIAAEQFPPLLAELASIAADLAVLEDQLEAKGAPWTPGRIPDWSAD